MTDLMIGTFVSVGNATQAFSRLLNEVSLIASSLPQPVVVQHGHAPFLAAGCQGLAFVEMNQFEHLVAKAELLVLHAGAGSVIHAIRAGKVPVVMPRRAACGEHVDDHQVEFARALEAAGRVVVAYEPGQLGNATRRALEIQLKVANTADAPLMVRLVDETLARYAELLS